jgi:hypothetical protein
MPLDGQFHVELYSQEPSVIISLPENITRIQDYSPERLCFRACICTLNSRGILATLLMYTILSLLYFGISITVSWILFVVLGGSCPPPIISNFVVSFNTLKCLV